MPFGSSQFKLAASALVSAPVQYLASVYPISVPYSRLFPDRSITTRPEADSSTVVRLSLVRLGLPESQALRSFDCPSWEEAPLPNLLPPTDRGGGGASAVYGPEDARSSISIETDLDIETLINHYNSQFEQADWLQIDGGEGELSRWSIWSFQDEEGENWRGLLVISKVQETPSEYVGFVQIFRRPRDN
ncbi:hypothetical protein H6G00_04750 [Leptolyngbya sp. FACHB-541]|uniref:hypothetical protein n=1 Tax=Leptolyngbya sp. FACHB-541 TaxID=2692810 RepID=UPI001687ED94|nr:hypothetical protein [Leptolyngbya sp. FACHB-541]MBD1995927.1 hypothetical protein [Leptolyngbya sp. FACHB-541]